MPEKIAVIGLGYVGLPVAILLAKKNCDVIGFDINENRINDLKNNVDVTNEVTADELTQSKLEYTSDVKDLKGYNFIIVTVPTPIDSQRQPDLSPLKSACTLIGPILEKNSIVVFESTVYPGVTEEFCGPLLQKLSGLECGKDFFLGYSPERINPGDKNNRLENIVKIVSGQTPETTEKIKDVYGLIIDAGLHIAPSIKVAEAAKVIENTQRDLNIALMNELAIIFDKLDIKTSDVLEAAGTKWNFLKFSPGLVGGHCIGVDPYYLTAKAEAVGYHPEVILAGRRINDGMGDFIVNKIIKMMIAQEISIRSAKIGILGLTFKENVPDLRNSKVPDIIKGFKEYGLECLINDPHANKKEALKEYDITLSDLSDFEQLDVLIVAVPHEDYKDLPAATLTNMLAKNSVVYDVKSIFEASDFPNSSYKSL